MSDIEPRFTSYVPASSICGQRVRGILSAMRGDCIHFPDGGAEVRCPDEKLQRQWLRRLLTAERNDILDKDPQP